MECGHGPLRGSELHHHRITKPEMTVCDLHLIANSLTLHLVPCSAPALVRGASRGEWWFARTPTAAATATVTKGWNQPSPKAATRGPVHCGTTASGGRWGISRCSNLFQCKQFKSESLLWFRNPASANTDIHINATDTLMMIFILNLLHQSCSAPIKNLHLSNLATTRLCSKALVQFARGAFGSSTCSFKTTQRRTKALKVLETTKQIRHYGCVLTRTAAASSN